ncbi:MAG TPA: phospholipid carrier-dependent glycosyltransferase [Thermodesulfobacteriota bacterium]
MPRAPTVPALALLPLLLFAAQGVAFIRANTETYDEAMHLAAGYSYLVTRDFRLEPQNPPLVKAYLALPVLLAYRPPFAPDPRHWQDANAFLIGHAFLYGSPVHATALITASRLANLLLGVLLAALVGLWAGRLWGRRAALLAMALASLEPNLVAHASLVTTDVGVTLFVFATVYALWEYLRAPGWGLLAAAGATTGMALASKFSAVLLLPTIGALVVLSPLVAGRSFRLPSAREPATRSHVLLQSAAVLLVILATALVTVTAAYAFQGFEPWLAGFARFLELGRGGQWAFFMGAYDYRGWWSYFPVAFLIKTPLGSLALIAASVVLYRAGSPLALRDATFLGLPVLALFAAMTQSTVNIGLRHVLPVYPFLFVLASRLATLDFGRRVAPRLLVGGPLLLTAAASLGIAPHHLAYFNALVGGPDRGHRYLLDSNLDWGQDLKGVKAYMEREGLPVIYLSYFGTAPPAYYGIRYQYVPGSWPLTWPPPDDRVPADAPRKVLAISVNNLEALPDPANPLFGWLRSRRPVATIGHSILVYDLTDDPDGLAKLEETYARAGVRMLDVARGRSGEPPAAGE